MEKETLVKHLAGIVPIASPESFFNMPWHDCLMPLNNNYLAIEKAVFDCALAGCDTIWIVGHLGTQPLVRKRLGEMIYDPLKMYSGKELFFKRHDADLKNIEIQIYYIPIHPKDKNKKDSLAYSVLYGADTAIKVCSNISIWAEPKMFFCSFPYGVVSEPSIYEFRKHANKTTNSLMVYDGKTVKDGLMLPFTFSKKDLQRCKGHIRDYELSVWENNINYAMPTIHFSVKEVFSVIDSSQSNIVKSDWYHQIDSWDNYKNFLLSSNSLEIKKREDLFKRIYRSDLDFKE